MDPSTSDQGIPDPPSKAKLAWATLAALVVAGVVLVATVLPAEYDIDPLGIGEALGLRVLSTPRERCDSRKPGCHHRPSE